MRFFPFQCLFRDLFHGLELQAGLLDVFLLGNESNDCERSDGDNSNKGKRWPYWVANALKFVLPVKEDNRCEWQDNDQSFLSTQFVFGLLTYSHSLCAF